MNAYRFADMTDIPHDCRDCKHNDKQWYEMPCDACCPAHCGFEKKERNNDVVEVVRCKDCKHYNAIDTDRLSECEKGFETYGNDFCNYGERAEK